MVKLTTFSLLIWSIICFSQTGKLTDIQLNASGANKIFFIENILQAQDLARKDIENGNPLLFLQSGIAPITYSKDYKFEENFNVYYFDFGCVGPEQEFALEYNKIIFEYLKKTYSKKWIKYVRKDVIGLRNYKKESK